MPTNFRIADQSAQLIARSRMNLAISDRLLEQAIYLRALLGNLAHSPRSVTTQEATSLQSADSD
jgi:hypothetical protein